MFDFKIKPRPGGSAVLLLGLIAASMASPLGGLWPLGLLVPALLHGVLAGAWAPLRGGAECWRRGRPAWLLVVGFTVVSTGGLLLWATLTQPDLHAARAQIPSVPPSVLVGLALAFAGGNALLEEAVFRGVLFDRLRAWLGDGPAPHLLQATAFGLVHWHGIPGGAAGVVLAGVWGLGLSLLRQRSGGLLAPLLAHVAADLCIFALLVAQ